RFVSAIATASLDVHGEHHVRAKGANEANKIANGFSASPLFDYFLRIERIAKVDGAGEVLFCAIEAMRRKELGSAQDTHVVEEFGTDFVLSTFPARGLQADGAETHAVSEHGKKR